MEGAPFQPWTAAAGAGAAGEEVPVKRERDERPLDAGRLASLQRVVENSLGAESRQRVAALLEQTELLTALEKLLFYLKLPAGPAAADPLKQPLNALGSRSEIQQTVTWIQTHLEVDAEVSLPKQDVYDEYIAFCMSSSTKALSTADFGKVMKQVYPQVRPRRLGTRGNSRYCYAGLRKRIKLEVPQLPDLADRPPPPPGSAGGGGGGGAAEVGSAEGAEGAQGGGAARLVCEWAEGILGVKVLSLPELAAHLQRGGPAPPPPPSPPPRHLAPPPHPLHQPAEVRSGGEAAGARNPRLLLGQLKRKIQLQSSVSPKKNKASEGAESASAPAAEPPPAPASPPPPPPQLPAEYPYPVGYAPAYEPRAPYVAYPGAYRDYPAPYRSTEAPYPAHLPINLSSDAAAYPPTLDLSPPARHEWPPERPHHPQHHHQHHHQPTRLSLPGKKMILEAYHNETQSGSPRPHTSRAPPADLPHLYLPKKMRAAESLGGKLAAARHAAAAAAAAAEPPPHAVPHAAAHAAPHAAAHAGPPPTPAPERPAAEDDESLPHYERAFLGCPKNLAGRSKSIAAALVRRETEAEAAPTRAPARGRGRRVSPGGAGRGRGRGGGRARRRRASAPRAPSPDSCCGLDGINLKTGIICKENHSEILNRERVISICSMDKHALDDYLNEGSSQEHEEELMQYFQRSEPALSPADPTHSDKLSQLRDLLARNLKHQSDAPRAQPSAPFDHQPSALNDAQPRRFAPDRTPGESERDFEEIPGSPTSRMQQYDFVPISPSDRSPGRSGAAPTERTAATEAGAPLRSPHSHSTQASPFVSPRDTPVPRSRLHPKPLPDKLSRRKITPCGVFALGPESCQKQIGFAVPTDQKCVPKSPGYGARAKHLPMSAPPSPNILSSRYKMQFPPGACHAANGNGVGYGAGAGVVAAHHDLGNGEGAPHSADPLSSEVSQFFQEPLAYEGGFHDEASFRSQSVPLHKEACARQPLYSYNNTPAGSVPPTPVPHEFCDFVSLSETCESISKAGLNSESLDKIYNVLDSGAAGDVLHTHRPLNGALDQLHALLPSDHLAENDLLKRAGSVDLDLSELVMDRSRYLSSRSVPSTPLPYGGAGGVVANGASDAHLHYPLQPSKSVPSTPLLGEARGGVFSYSNRDFLINGNSLETEGAVGAELLELHKDGGGGDAGHELQDMLREECLDLPQLPAADLLADLDPSHHHYPDL